MISPERELQLEEPAANNPKDINLQTPDRKGKRMTILFTPESLDDHSMIDLDLDKKLAQIDYDKMKENVKLNHPFRKDGKRYSCMDVFCNTTPGHHRILTSTEKGDFDIFGVGIVLYFKFMKLMISLFFMFAVISIPAYVFYIRGYIYNNSDSDLNYGDGLTATTLGSIGYATSICSMSNYSQSTTTTTSLNCTTGTIGTYSFVSYGFISKSTSCSLINSYDVDFSCNAANTTAFENAWKSQCYGQTTCQLTFDNSWFSSTSGCTSTYSNKYLYIQAICASQTIKITSDGTVSKKAVAITVAALDALIVLIFALMIHFLKFSQSSAIKNVLKSAYSASLYTVNIKNLPEDSDPDQLTVELWHFIEDKIKGHCKVVDVHLVFPSRIFELQARVGEIITHKNNLTRKWMQIYKPDAPEHKIKFSQITEYVNELTKARDPRRREARKMYLEIKNLVTTKVKYSSEIEKLKDVGGSRIVSAFVTFESVDGVRRTMNQLNPSPCDLFFKRLCPCVNKGLTFHGRILKAEYSDDPNNILWENLGEPFLSKFFRRGTSTLLTVILWVIIGVVIAISTRYKNSFLEKYPQAKCTAVDYTESQVVDDYKLGTLSQGLLGCYCKVDLINRIDDVFTSYNDEKLCLTWFTDRVISYSVTFAIVFVVIISNFLVQVIFRALSRFERHESLTNQLSSRVVKTFFAQYLNTAIILVLINTHLDGLSFWEGKYVDAIPLWYANVGSVLLSTMVINIASTPIIKLIPHLLKKCKRCMDRKCTFDDRITRKPTQAKYQELYLGVEFMIDARYSQVLTLIAVCFTFSAGMPILYITTFLNMSFNYLADKYLILRACRLPNNYSEKLEQIVRVVLYYIVLIHLLISIYFYGASYIFEDGTTDSNSIAASLSNISAMTSGVVTKFFNRMVLTQNLVLLALLAIFVVLLVIKGGVLDCLDRTIFSLCKRSKDDKRVAVIPETTGEIKEEDPKKQVEESKDKKKFLKYFEVIPSVYYPEMIKMTQLVIMHTENSDLKLLLTKKLNNYNTSFAKKSSLEKDGLDDPNLNFIGLPTYDIRLIPRYRKIFGIDEKLNELANESAQRILVVEN